MVYRLGKEPSQKSWLQASMPETCSSAKLSRHHDRKSSAMRLRLANLLIPINSERMELLRRSLLRCAQLHRRSFQRFRRYTTRNCILRIQDSERRYRSSHSPRRPSPAQPSSERIRKHRSCMELQHWCHEFGYAVDQKYGGASYSNLGHNCNPLRSKVEWQL